MRGSRPGPSLRSCSAPRHRSPNLLWSGARCLASVRLSGKTSQDESEHSSRVRLSAGGLPSRRATKPIKDLDGQPRVATPTDWRASGFADMFMAAAADPTAGVAPSRQTAIKPAACTKCSRP